MTTITCINCNAIIKKSYYNKHKLTNKCKNSTLVKKQSSINITDLSSDVLRKILPFKIMIKLVCKDFNTIFMESAKMVFTGYVTVPVGDKELMHLLRSYRRTICKKDIIGKYDLKEQEYKKVKYEEKYLGWGRTIYLYKEYEIMKIVLDKYGSIKGLQDRLDEKESKRLQRANRKNTLCEERKSKLLTELKKHNITKLPNSLICDKYIAGSVKNLKLVVETIVELNKKEIKKNEIKRELKSQNIPERADLIDKYVEELITKDELIERTKELEERKNKLTLELRRWGVEFRSDSTYCTGYLNGTINDEVEKVGRRMAEMKYLFEYLNMRRMLREYRDNFDWQYNYRNYHYNEYDSDDDDYEYNREQEYREYFEYVEKTVLRRNGGYPRVFPWLR